MAKKTQIESFLSSLRLRDSRNEKYYLRIIAKSDLGESHELLPRSKNSHGVKIFLEIVETARESEFSHIVVERFESLTKGQPAKETITLSLDEKEVKAGGEVDTFFAAFGGLQGFKDFNTAQSQKEVEMFLHKEKSTMQEEKIKELKESQTELKTELAELKRKNEFLNDQLRDERYKHEDSSRELEKKANLFAGLGVGLENIASKWLSGMGGNAMSGTQEIGTQATKIADVSVVQEFDDTNAHNSEIADKIKKWLLDNPDDVADKVMEIIRFIAKSEENFNQVVEIIKISNHA